MKTGLLHELGNKLDFAKAGKPAIFGIAAILACVLVTVAFCLFNASAADNFAVTSEDSNPTQAAPEHATTSLYVHVSGAVINPGLYEIPQSSRVADAITAAGGFSENADESGCNLARPVEDGEHIVIPAIPSPTEQAADASQPGQAAVQTQTGVVNLNTATQEQLESLPGIGSSIAQRIIAERSSNGPFASVDDLQRVSGIGDKKLQALEGLVCV